MARVQERRAFFFQPQEFKVDAGFIPSQRAADFCGGLKAAIFRPACAQRHGHATQENIAQCYGGFMRHGLYGFRHEMTAMLAERLAQAFVE